MQYSVSYDEPTGKGLSGGDRQADRTGDARAFPQPLCGDLCVLREQTGWGRERLCRFAEELVPRMMDLTERYELPEQSLGWLCEEKISALGVDLDAIVQKALILRGATG